MSGQWTLHLASWVVARGMGFAMLVCLTVSVAASLFIYGTIGAFLVPRLLGSTTGWLLAGIIPAVVSPMVSYVLCSLLIQLRQSQDALAALALSDELTGVPNRRSFLRSLQAQLARSARSGRPVSMLIVDIDHFKKINDTFGHDVGDQVIQRVAQGIAHRVRESDTFARFGGEEFTLLMPDTNLAQAGVVAEQVLRLVRDLSFPVDHALRVTVSIGVSQGVPSVSDVAALLKDADVALYAAKRAGRDRVVLAELPHPPADPAGPSST